METAPAGAFCFLLGSVATDDWGRDCIDCLSAPASRDTTQASCKQPRQGRLWFVLPPLRHLASELHNLCKPPSFEGGVSEADGGRDMQPPLTQLRRSCWWIAIGERVEGKLPLHPGFAGAPPLIKGRLSNPAIPYFISPLIHSSAQTFYAPTGA